MGTIGQQRAIETASLCTGLKVGGRRPEPYGDCCLRIKESVDSFGFPVSKHSG